MQVHNIRGTSDRNPKNGCKSWLDFWIKNKGYKPAFCCCEACTEEQNLVGAHVQESGSDTRDYWYILPLCRKHNNLHYTESFEVWEPNDLVRITDID